jgi:hypothetical protein
VSNGKEKAAKHSMKKEGGRDDMDDMDTMDEMDREK